jgi:tetratricopeptide (TPR) repeat protein
MAGLILSVFVLLGGGAGWVVRDRAAQRATTEREVIRALDEAAMLEAQAKWSEALEAAKRAEGILAAGASAEMRRRVGELRKDVEMVLRLEEIWTPRDSRRWAGERFRASRAAAYATAFREYGIDVEALEPSEAAARIRARKIRLELALALDFWALARRNTTPRGDGTERRLLAVARAADPDEWRNQTRTAFAQRDYKAFKKLAATDHVGDQPVQTLSLLVSRPEVEPQIALPLLRQAQQAHPDSFEMNFQLAWTLQYGRPQHQQDDEAIRFYTAALALRPRNSPTWHWLAVALRGRGRLDEQIACERKSIALEPNFLSPYFALSSALEAQGKRDEAIAVLRKASDASSDDPQDLNNLSWFLATSHFCELRDARRAVELAQKAVELAPEDGTYWNTLGAAQYRTGSWQAAIAAFEKSMALGGGGNSFDWFFLAMAHWQLGGQSEALEWYNRAVQWMEKNKPKDDELRRFRVEAEELLQINDQKPSKRKLGPG